MRRASIQRARCPPPPRRRRAPRTAPGHGGQVRSMMATAMVASIATANMCLRDIFPSKSSFANYVSARNSQLLSHRKIEHGLSFIWNKRIGLGWKNHIQMPKRSRFGGLLIDKKDEHLIKAVVTVEPTSVPTADDEMCSTTLEYGDCQLSQFSHEESPEIDDREKLRRMRISKANKGNVPWNKGRKHSQETLQRIRERTKLAMQDPKVKMKLVNLGHAQSKETRLKIGVGVREGWQKRREKLTVQEGCCIEWQNVIAEAARNGLVGEEELHWDSYKILDEQLMQEWLESVERRKTMPRLKGSKRAPKSPEQRRKISESISAKWADPGYRDRVCSALAKYHGTPIGADRRRRRKPPTQTADKKEPVIKKSMQPKSSSTETKITKNASKKKNSSPSYKDPMASTKLEMIKKIKVQRAALEEKKKDAIERAKLLITEAEKAAKALEMAALKSPIARASLLETRKLIAKATRSIEGINHGQVPMEDTAEDISSGSAVSERSAGSQNCENVPDERLINGEAHLFSSNNGSYKDFDKSTHLVVLNGRAWSWVSDYAENLTEVFHHCHSPSSESESERKDVSSKNLLAGSSTVNGSIIVHNKIVPAGGDESLRINKDEVSTSAAKTKLKWVCGKLVEVEED